MGQEVEQSSLISVLKSLESRYEVRFSFVPSELEDSTVAPPDSDLKIADVLNYLRDNTPFLFSRINERYISVASNESSKPYCGKIIDSSTGEPLEAATVIVAQDGFGTTTDGDGLFLIPKKYKDLSFRIQYLGYQTIESNVNTLSENCAHLELMPTFSRLNETLIRNFLVKGIDLNRNGSITISTRNFGLLPGQTENDVLQMAQTLPGVESINETISTINTRGGSNDENLITWEGIRMFQTGHFFGLISAFNPNLTQNVDIYKNGTPARYGESVSGVIDMASSDSIAGQLQGGAGINLIHANAFVEVPINPRMGVQISGRGAINGIIQTPVYNTYAQRIFQDTEVTNIANNQQSMEIDAQEDFGFYDLGFKFLWNPTDRDKVRTSFLTINNNLDFTETLIGAPESQTSKLEQRSVAGGASWTRDWSSQFSTRTQWYGSYYLLEALNTDIFTTQVLFQENEVLELGLSLETDWTINGLFTLNSGYRFSELGISNTQDVNLPRFRDFEKDVLRSHIVHGSLQYESNNKKTTITGGLRANYFDKFNETLVEPRLHVFQKLGFGFAAQLSGEIKSQTATQRIDFESDFLGVEKRRWVLATDDEIPIKKSRQISMGLVYNKNNWFVNLEGFYKKVAGITSKSQGFQNQFQFVNTVGEYEVQGIEFILNKKIDRFSGWITYSYNTNDYRFDAFIPTEFPNNIDVRHSAKVAATYTFGKLKISSGLNWRTGKPFTTPIAGSPFVIQNTIPVIQFNPPNENRLPDYWRWDISAEYLWNLSNGLDAKINFALLNITDRENTLNIRYVLEEEDGTVSVNKIEELSLGFTPNFSFQVNF